MDGRSAHYKADTYTGQHKHKNNAETYKAILLTEHFTNFVNNLRLLFFFNI